MSNFKKGAKKKRDCKKREKEDECNIPFQSHNALKIETNTSEVQQIRGHKGYESLIFKESMGMGTHYSAIKIQDPQQVFLNGNISGEPAIRFGVVNSLLYKKYNKIISIGSNEGTYAIKTLDMKLISSQENRFVTYPGMSLDNLKTGDVISLVLKIGDLKNPLQLENEMMFFSEVDRSGHGDDGTNLGNWEDLDEMNDTNNKSLDVVNKNELSGNGFGDRKDEIWLNNYSGLDFYVNGSFVGRFDKLVEGEYKVGVSLYMGARVQFEWGESEIKEKVMGGYV